MGGGASSEVIEIKYFFLEMPTQDGFIMLVAQNSETDCRYAFCFSNLSAF
jgi:hypothetical protein